MRVVFMGTPRFALPTLEAVLSSRHSVVGVVTAPSKPTGRSLKVTDPPVKTTALTTGLPVLQPDDLNDPGFVSALAGWQPDIGVIVAFRILPPAVFGVPRLGCVNLHASLLPDLRGAAPINWALMRGLEKTGLTTFLIDKGVDTGGVLLQREEPVYPDDNADSLSERLAKLGASLMVETLDGMETGLMKPHRQSGAFGTAPKLTRDLCRIDWSAPSLEIHNRVRGLATEPAAFTTLEGKVLKILRTRLMPADTLDAVRDQETGTITVISSEAMIVKTGDSHLQILELQLEGRRWMTTSEFLRGRRLSPGTRLGG
ncbi:MAG: methionyl-tRNA formyltransferase [Calditrichaeota bacterium]|nr:methionyl-tRNA formyltransferase [Calditrichota bacterium]